MDNAAWTAITAMVIAIVTAVANSRQLRYKASIANVVQIEGSLERMAVRLTEVEKKHAECKEENIELKARIAILEVQSKK